MKIREITESMEKQNFSKYAALSMNTKGRLVSEEKCDIRTDYQRDRDRILHSKAFRRLKHKTQVFISPEGDHYRTRLTHTLEVSQIARTIARALRLNEDLTEAIALGHDLGHTPFGHAGEKVLNELHPGGFKHNEQSLRVVDILEGGKGLNLTYEVRDGILKHPGELVPETLEGRIVSLSDRVAYINHDIDDALRGGILEISSIPEECMKVLGYTHKQRINTMINDIITESMCKEDIMMSSNVNQASRELRKFMFDMVYIGSAAKVEEKKTKNIIKGLYEYYIQNPEEIPVEDLRKKENANIDRLVCDYIAGMSDRFAINIFTELFIPSPWQV
ncbi:MAG: deoxyguanosinetriphosphate triphosphohydrolase [Clostridia bacterium BRH_c25]|nr:MAG: deoxyguanosinetriphosphate triphosphohydrolase [Clostridia bacterium BRH_c25]